MKARTLGGSAVAVALTGALLVASRRSPFLPKPDPIATRAIATLKMVKRACAIASSRR